MPIWSSLTSLYQPEYDRQVDAIMRIGIATARWRVPDLRVYRSSSHGPDALAMPMLIRIYLRPNTWSLGAVHQTMAHELAHTLTWDETEDHGHGPRFRNALRRIVRACWPTAEPWKQSQQPNYEDMWMTMAIDKVYGDANRLPHLTETNRGEIEEQSVIALDS